MWWVFWLEVINQLGLVSVFLDSLPGSQWQQGGH